MYRIYSYDFLQWGYDSPDGYKEKICDCSEGEADAEVSKLYSEGRCCCGYEPYEEGTAHSLTPRDVYSVRVNCRDADECTLIKHLVFEDVPGEDTQSKVDAAIEDLLYSDPSVVRAYLDEIYQVYI